MGTAGMNRSNFAANNGLEADKNGKVLPLKLSAQDIIRWLRLKPHPEEGGYYSETYRSRETISPACLPDRYGSARSLGTAIYYLLTPDTCSRIHRLKSDEVFHFYLGDPVTLLLLEPDHAGRTLILGPDLIGGQHLQAVVPRNVWQGSFLNPGGEFALLGTTVAPGFDYADFEHGVRDDLLRQFPDQVDLICRLTR